ncbi:bestrophin family protein [Pendulispora albinea]|uniref:Bestrophin n=1 Tax=Pendulispora albinea TaxID=2741071 RepID=A0ABZ2LZD3_9BACT
MWVERNRSWFATVALGGYVLPRIWKRTLMVTAVSVIVTVLYHAVPVFHHSIGDKPFALIGLPLGIFLGFRNNAAYERFWEGRKLWGSLVNTSRSLTRQVLTLLEPEEGPGAPKPDALIAFERHFVHMIIGYVHALRHHLRDTDSTSTLERILPPGELDRVRGDDNVPLALLQRMGELMSEARQRHWVNPYHVAIFEQSLVSLTDIQGACERIKSTPIPYSYTVLMHRIVAGYCTLLPFGLDETAGDATPLVVLAISYAFFGLDAIGAEIEQPFGTDINDLPLGGISTTIERNLRARLREELPPAAAPYKGVLT